MDKEQMEMLYLEQVQDYCNVLFDKENIPAGVQLALNELVKTDPMQYNITSEKLSDMSTTYTDNKGAIPKYILGWLAPYRRVFLVGNKEKRHYSGSKRYKQSR